MLMAMTILILTLSAVTLTSFGSQTMITDGQIDREALSKAEERLENAQTLARKDFKLVNPTTTTEILGGVTYTEILSVSTTTAPDFATKRITSTVTWSGEHGRSQHVSLFAIVTNFTRAVGGDTCDSQPTGDWKNPFIQNSITSISQLLSTSTSINVITSVDAHKGKLYVGVGNTTYTTDPTFLIFDIAKLKTNPTSALLGKLDTANTTTEGLFALHIAEGTSTGSMYAYAANEHVANWSTCTQNYNCAQLQIIDVSSSTKLSLASTTNYKIPSTAPSSVKGTGGQAVGSSIFYKDGLVYLGLTKTLSGPEFNIIDVHDPLHPAWVGGYSVGATVSAITIANNLAYLATSDNARELIVLNVSNPVNPKLASTYNALGSAFGYGQTLYLTGDKLYFGRTYISGAPELYILDASSSSSIITDPPLGAYDIGTSASPFSVLGVIARDTLTFVAGGSPSTGGKFEVLNTANPSAITLWTTPLPLPGTSIGSALDCEGNDFFASSNDSSNNGYLSVISAP